MAYISRHEWRPPDTRTFQTDIHIIYSPEGDSLHINGVNTYIRTYDEGGGKFDHIATVIWLQPEDIVKRTPLLLESTAHIAGELIRHNFPHYHDALAEPDVKEWAASLDFSEEA